MDRDNPAVDVTGVRLVIVSLASLSGPALQKQRLAIGAAPRLDTKARQLTIQQTRGGRRRPRVHQPLVDRLHPEVQSLQGSRAKQGEVSRLSKDHVISGSSFGKGSLTPSPPLANLRSRSGRTRVRAKD